MLVNDRFANSFMIKTTNKIKAQFMTVNHGVLGSSPREGAITERVSAIL